MEEKTEYLSLSEAANLMGISRIAVYKKVKKHQLKSIKIGRSFAIPKSELPDVKGRQLRSEEKKEIDRAVRKTVKQYGDVLKRLGKE
jgi:excisionase family DNA binding protein